MIEFIAAMMMQPATAPVADPYAPPAAESTVTPPMEPEVPVEPEAPMEPDMEAAQEVQPAKAARTGPAGDDIVCRRKIVNDPRLPGRGKTRKVCKTREEWGDRAAR